MDKTEIFNVAINPTESYSKTVCEQTYSATIASQNVELRTNIETEKHKAKFGVTYLLEGSQECYKGEFPNISDLSSIKAYEGDYADIYETQTRWKYSNGAWIDTQDQIEINPKIVTTDNISTENKPNTIPKRDDNGNFEVGDPLKDLDVVNKQYLQQTIAQAIKEATESNKKSYVKDFTKDDFKLLGFYSTWYLDIPKSEHGLGKPYVSKILGVVNGDNEDEATFLTQLVVKEKTYANETIRICINIDLNQYTTYSGKIYLLGE